MMISCYHSSFSSLFNTKKTIEIGNFSEVINIPGRSISFDLKKNIEDYITKYNPSNLVLKKGNVVLEGVVLYYGSYPLGDYKKVKITVKIFYKDKSEPKNDWEKDFIISEVFYDHIKEVFPRKIIDKIINKLTVRIYSEIFNDSSI